MSKSRISLDGKVAIVTGGGAGIGRATVALMIERGAQVVVSDIDEAAGQETVALHGGDGRAIFVKTDVADEQSVQHLIDATLDRFGRLDIAHNNAGFGRAGINIIDVKKESWDQEMAVDLTGVFLCIRAQIPAMLRTGGGSIVNTASGAGVVAQPGQSAYVAAKHGVIGLTKAAAVEYARQGIRVNAVLPGAVRTTMLDLMAERAPDLVRKLIDGRPMGRAAEPFEIAEAVVWLASDAASYVTGASLSVDGGFVAQ